MPGINQQITPSDTGDKILNGEIMNAFIKNLIQSISSPRTLYLNLSSKSNINHAVFIAIIIGLVHGLYIMASPYDAYYFQNKVNAWPSKLGFAVTFGLLYVLQTGVQIALNVLCVKIVFYFLKIKTNFKTLITVFSFVLVPQLVREVILVFWHNYMDAVSFGSKIRIDYYKTSLATLVAGRAVDNKYLFYLLAQVEIFTLWSLLMGILAVTVLGKVSYRIGLLTMLLYLLIPISFYLLSLY